MKIKTVIVDDEALSRRGIERLLRQTPDFEVIAECGNGRDAVGVIQHEHPEVVFLDIQMPVLSGFEVLARLPQDSVPLVVFVTAFDQYALRAFEARAVDYLLKPVDERRFEMTLDRVRQNLQARHAVDQRDKLMEVVAEITGAGEIELETILEHGSTAIEASHPQILPIRQGRHTARVPVTSIQWIDAAGDYMCVHAEGDTHILRGTMKELEEVLDPRIFQRVHRSTIVNLRYVKSLRAHMNGEYFLTLDGGQELKLSRTYRDKIEIFLGNSPLQRSAAE
ncbi:MAG: response regulator [Pseudomonadota bacterium]|jgi:two-component system LytT family response regulator|nr:response regulator [Pseudomonadota bacterium]